MAELNAAALDAFVYQPVSKQMIAYLAGAAFNVIACDSHLMPPGAAEAHRRSQLPPTPPRTPEPREVRSEDADLPTLEAFITQLVVSSNVQVPTLMSTLVYLGRLKSKLQPMARGLRCTTHRIFLASLILAAKYLNDSSPKNKHWAAYTNAPAEDYSSFGFSRSEVNLMERQLLLLLDWDLRISEEDLYREFEPFLAPIREQVQAKHAQRVIRRRRAQDERRQLRKAQEVAEAYAAAAASYPSPASSRDTSRSRYAAEHHARSRSTASTSSSLTTPPPLVHTNSYGSSYAADAASIRSRSIRAVTPPDACYADVADPQVYVLPDGSLYDSPVEVSHLHAPRRKDLAKPLPAMLPYEISADDYAEMHYASSRSKKARFGTAGRSMLDRFFGAVTVR
ncbi:PHO85 cyclin-1 [Plectosphaerella cucumerina]|uniref:PHO85 cyclin-1 n=1 Tax=Plectosphaerella cucumerina TaxID=40658 RepID=A0A8K0TPY2_9PEZI|nr:PHO85 cyclin-1 [Plectosphaerella cucumerina]